MLSAGLVLVDDGGDDSAPLTLFGTSGAADAEEDDDICDTMSKVMSHVKAYQKEVQLYRQEFGGRHFTKEELEKIESMLEWLKNHPHDSEDAD